MEGKGRAPAARPPRAAPLPPRHPPRHVHARSPRRAPLPSFPSVRPTLASEGQAHVGRGRQGQGAGAGVRARGRGVRACSPAWQAGAGAPTCACPFCPGCVRRYRSVTTACIVAGQSLPPPSRAPLCQPATPLPLGGMQSVAYVGRSDMACPHTRCLVHLTTMACPRHTRPPSIRRQECQAYRAYPTPTAAPHPTHPPCLPHPRRSATPHPRCAVPLRIQGALSDVSELPRFSESDMSLIGSQRHPSPPTATQTPVQTDTTKLRPSPRLTLTPHPLSPRLFPSPLPLPPSVPCTLGRTSEQLTGLRKNRDSMPSLREGRHPHPRNLCSPSLRSVFPLWDGAATCVSSAGHPHRSALLSQATKPAPPCPLPPRPHESRPLCPTMSGYARVTCATLAPLDVPHPVCTGTFAVPPAVAKWEQIRPANAP